MTTQPDIAYMHDLDTTRGTSSMAVKRIVDVFVDEIEKRRAPTKHYVSNVLVTSLFSVFGNREFRRPSPHLTFEHERLDQSCVYYIIRWRVG